MSRQSRRERKEEERRILAEMDAAMMEKTGGETPAQNAGAEPCEYCPRCRSAIEKNRCPVCGYRVYKPMNEKTRRTVRIVLGIVLVAVFAVIFFGPQLFGD